MKLQKHLAQGRIIYFKAGQQQLTITENNHYRWLSLNDVVQSIMLKRHPCQLVLPHQLAMVLPLQFFKPHNILEIGLGGGALIRFIKQLLPHCNFTSLELDKSVIDAFNCFFNPAQHYTTIINEGAECWLKTQPCVNVDWLIIDVFLTMNDSVISSGLVNMVLNKTQEQTLITLNLPNEQAHSVNALLKHLKQITGAQVLYFNVPHYKNIVVHILPVMNEALTDNPLSPLKPYQQSRWHSLWQHGIQL